MGNDSNLWKMRVFVLTLLILLTVVIPAKAELLDQSILSTRLSSEVASESSGSYIEDTTSIMKDGLLDVGRRAQKSKGKYDILSFRLNTDATQLPNLNLSVYVNNIYSSKTIDGWGTQTARVYAYNADGYSAQSSTAIEFTLSYGWNDLDITRLLPLMNGFGFVKFRIVAVQNWLDISEARFSVINHSPVAVSNGPYNGISTNSVTFRSDGSYDPDSDAITYLWDFGDGSTSTEQNPTHTYTSAGRYTVTLTITDTYGQSALDSTTATIFSETFETIRPTDAYNPEGWINPSNGYDGNPGTYTYKKTASAVPSISFGGSSSNESVNAWQSKSKYWYSAWLYITFDTQPSGRIDDLVEIAVTDRYGNLKHTILPQTSGVTKKEFIQKLNMSDWGDGFSNIANLRVRVNGYKKKGADGAESRVYDIRIDGDTASVVKDHTRGAYISLPWDDSNLATTYSLAEEIDVVRDDGSRVLQTGSANQYLIHQFKQKPSFSKVTIKWNGQINEQGVEAYAQSFTPNTSGDLTGVRIFFKKVGSPDGYVRVRIKSELGGEVLAETKPVAESSFDTLGSWKTFTLDYPASVVAGNTYYVEIWRDRSDGSNYPEVREWECPDFEGSTWVRSGGNWSIEPLYHALLFEIDINSVLDVAPYPCYVPLSSGDKKINGLDWRDIYLETYNRTTSSWIQLDTGLYNGSTTDIDLSGTVSSDDYFDDNGWIAARVYTLGNGKNSLSADLIDFNINGEISVYPQTLDFGSVEIGSSSLIGFTVSNVGAGDLIIGKITEPSSPFSVTSDGCSGLTLPASASCSVTVKFNPTAVEEFTDILTISSNDVEHPNITVNLSGTGILPPFTITITSPVDGTVFNSSPIDVIGNVGNYANVTVNGVQASVSNNAFSALIPLNEGKNTITATAIDMYGQTASHSITVILITKGNITGTVTDLSTGLPISSATVSVTDSSNITQNALTDINGKYTINGISSGAFSGTIIKDGYSTYNLSGTMSPGQIITIDTALSPILPVISNISVSNITRDSATITWTTDMFSDSRVEYGTTTSYGNLVTDPTLTTSHSITLTNLTIETTYHFKVTSTNSYSFSSSSGDNTFTTKSFIVKTLGDYGNVTVIEVTGNYDAKNPDGSINALPRQEIAKEFLKNHPDEYDFFVIFTNFDFSMPDASAKAFYLEVKNDVQGIGKQIFDNSSLFGSGKLQGIIEMGNVSAIVTDPSNPKFEETINNLAHEQMHRWGANVKFKDASGNTSTALLGKDGTHWSFLFDSDASVLYGNDWKDNGDGTFTSVSANKYYSPLDLYLMGLYDKSQVPPMLLIDNEFIDRTKLPEVGTTITGIPTYVTIDNITAAEGDRIPNASVSQKSFKTAFILITRPETYTGGELAGIENVRNAWAGRFAALTYGEGSISDVTPSITITIASPSDGETITGTDIMVRGSIINNTGNETGVTVNGVVATVYGNQFMANVPLQEGSNTITVTATDTAGNTATTSITINAVTTGNYIRLTSNIESGIAPLEVTLRIDGSFSINESTLSISGPVQPEVTFVSADEYTVKMTVEGIYYFTATTTGPDGLTYQDTTAITVLNRTQMDSLLKAKWEAMKEALMRGDTNEAVKDFDDFTKDAFKEVFTALLPQITQVVQEMSDIQIIRLIDNTTEYDIRVSRDGKEYSFYLLFIKGPDGIWKIRSF
ncbi:MAG: PKD domain-containing protein [Nitrospirota bacterium]